MQHAVDAAFTPNPEIRFLASAEAGARKPFSVWSTSITSV